MQRAMAPAPGALLLSAGAAPALSLDSETR
jgi:hypothetical protein